MKRGPRFLYSRYCNYGDPYAGPKDPPNAGVFYLRLIGKDGTLPTQQISTLLYSDWRPGCFTFETCLFGFSTYADETHRHFRFRLIPRVRRGWTTNASGRRVAESKYHFKWESSWRLSGVSAEAI